MNTKGIKFLAVLAVLAMAFAACAVLVNVQQDDAATTKANGSPLADGAVPFSSASVKIGNLTFTPYMQPTASISGANNAYTVYGTFEGKKAYNPTTMWSNVGYQEAAYTNAKVMSFSITGDADDTNKYYVYQESEKLTEKKKITGIVANVATAFDSDDGANPSYEILVPDSGKTVKLKLIKSTTTVSLDDAEKMAAGDNCVIYTVTTNGTTITDSNATSYGFFVKDVTDSDSPKYYNTLRAAVLANHGTDATHPAKFEILGSHDTMGLVWDTDPAMFVSVDFKGFTVNVVTAVGSSGTETQALRVLKGSFFEMKEGTLTSDCQDVIQMMHIFGTFKADKMTFDGSKIKAQDVSSTTKASHTICVENGDVEIKNSSIIGSATTKHNYALVIDEYNSTSYNGVKVTLDTVDIKGDILYGTESDNLPTGETANWTTSIKDVTLDGNITIASLNELMGWTGEHKTLSGEKITTLCSNLTITSLTVKDGSKMTIDTNFTTNRASVVLNVVNDGKIVNDGEIVNKVKLEFAKANTATADAKPVSEIGLLGTGKTIVKEGAILIVSQGKLGDSNRINAFCNEVVIEKGGRLYAHQYDNGDQKMYSLVGTATTTAYEGTGNECFRESGTGLHTTAAIALTNEKSTISIKPTYGSSTVTTVYKISGDAALGVTENATDTEPLRFQYLHGGDSFELVSGKLTLNMPAVIGGNVVWTIDVGSSIAAKTSTATETLKVLKDGVLNLMDSSLYYAGIVKSGGKVNIEGEGGSEQEVKDVTPEGTTIDESTFTKAEADVIVTTKADLTEVTVPTGKTAIIDARPATNAALDISADNSQLTVNTGSSAATYSVNAGGNNKIYLEDVKGSLTFTKGSVEIDISLWTGGKIKLDNGADVKIFGSPTATDDLKILMKTAGDKATLTIESDVDITVTFAADKVFEIGEGITFTVDGKLKVTADTPAYADLTTNDAVIIKGTVDVGGTFTAVETVDVYGVLKGTVDASEAVVAYGTSDINKATITIGKLSGKDKNGGVWTYDADADALTLNNYNGNYNFAQFVKASSTDKIKSIIVKGENKLTYKATKDYAGEILFGHATASSLKEIKTVQGTGLLEIYVDLSKATGANLASQLTVFQVETGAAFSLDAVSVKVTVSGTNTEWTAAQTKALKVVGIDASGAGSTMKMYNSGLDLDLMSAYTVKAGVATGIKSAGDISIDDSTVSITTAGAAITGGKLTVKGSTFALNAKLTALANGANDIEFSNSMVSISGKDSIISTGAMIEIKNSIMSLKGAASVKEMNLSSGSNVDVLSKLKAEKLILSQASEIEVKDLVLTKAGSVNDGTIVIVGTAVIEKVATLKNNATFTNNGTMGVYGTFENNEPGVFTNNGEFSVFGKTLGALGEFKIVGDAPHSDDSKARLRTISIPIAKCSVNADGSIYVHDIAPTFSMKDGFGTIKGGDEFEGTITPSQSDDSYVLAITNGTATIMVTYNADSTETATIGGKYTVTVSGVLVNEDDETKVLYLEANKSDKTVAPTDSIPALFTDSGAKLDLKSGSMINEGDATLYVSDADFLKKDASFDGDLTVEFTPVTLKGEFTGDLTVNGTGLVTVDNDFVGTLKSKGTVTLSKDVGMTGNIVAEGTVTIAGNLLGNVDITLKAPNTAKLTVSGIMLGGLTYVSLYKADKDDKTDTESTSKMGISADMVQTSGTKTFEINLAAATNATTSTAGTPGFFTFGSTMEAPAAGNNAALVLQEGMIKVPSTVIVPERFEIIINEATTLEVVKGATLDVKKAALKVSKDAIKHYETGTVAETYGLVGCVMSFDIQDGAFTIYSDVAYALTMCDEGAELTVTTSANIADNVTVKKGVNVIIADKVTLDFKTFGLDMADDAKITLMGTGKLLFGQTGEDKTDDADWKFFTISGTVVYDGNAIVLDDVRFDAAGAEFTGVAATASAGSKLSTKLNYSEGTVKVSAGTGSGSVALGNGSYPLQKGADDTLVFATFVVGTDAVFDASSITDAFCVVDYKKEGEDMIIDKYVLKPTIVGVEGTLNLANTTYMKGAYAGLGVIKLAAGKEFILDKADAKPADTKANVKIPGTAAVKIVDTTEFENGYALNLVSASPNATVAFKATTQKIGAETFNVMTIGGDVGGGIITATNDAFLNTVTIQEDAAIVAEDAFIIGNSKAIGFVGAKEIYMKEGTATSEFKTLDYQISFEKEDYTFYGYFATVDFEEVSDITINGSFDLVSHDEVVGLLPAGTTKVDLSGNDVNITIAEGKALTINVPLIIGTPIDSMGAEGSSITGKVIIKASADGATTPQYRYIVAYSDVDLLDAEIYQDGGKIAAVYSALLIDDLLYATIFANDGTYTHQEGAEKTQYGAGMGLALADKALVPDIEGYIFTKWSNLNEDDNAAVGETTAYANAKAVAVYVTVKFVNGITYYCNGIEFAVYDTPVKVEYNSVFTAKISDTTKYQGTPLVNGKNSLIITDDTVIVGSGVEPIPVPPEPEPEPVVGDSGLSLTDILLIVLVILIAIMVVILVLRLNRS